MRMSENQLIAHQARLSNGANKSKQDKPVAMPVSLALSPHAKALTDLFKNPKLGVGKEEHFIQVSLFDYFYDNNADIYDLMYAIPNSGKRHIKVATEMKAEGQKNGYPDMAIDAAKGIYHGFRLELKTETGRPQPNQVEYAVKLRKQGYCVVFCYGFECALKAIFEYWALTSNGVMTNHVYK